MPAIASTLNADHFQCHEALDRDAAGIQMTQQALYTFTSETSTHLSLTWGFQVVAYYREFRWYDDLISVTPEYRHSIKSELLTILNIACARKTACLH